MKNITLRQLRLFESVATNLSYSRAAEQMSLTQPAVSMQIQQLEAELGLQLLVKTGKRVTLNQAGEEMLRQTRRILNQMLIAEEAMVGFHLTDGAKGGFLHLGVVATALLVTRGAAAEEAARTLGASARDAFRRVTWPLLWRGLAPAVVAVFVFVTGNYEVAALLAPSNPPALALLVAERAADADLSRRGDAYVSAQRTVRDLTAREYRPRRTGSARRPRLSSLRHRHARCASPAVKGTPAHAACARIW